MSLTPKDLKDAYARGENISALLRSYSGTQGNTEAAIEVAYDLQAGSYVSAQAEDGQREIHGKYARAFAAEMNTLGALHSMLEAGVGEGTTLLRMLEAMNHTPPVIHGVDISWSRIQTGIDWFVKEGGPRHAKFMVGTMSRLPYADNSFDVVYTSHAIEPNGGREKELLCEVYRVASRYLVLFEPSYELAPAEGRERMESHGYCRDLPGHARALGMRLIKHEVLASCFSPYNPTAVTIIAKNPDAEAADPQVVCPLYHTPMEMADDLYFSADSLRAYPVLRGIPCLKAEHAIIASKLVP